MRRRHLQLLLGFLALAPCPAHRGHSDGTGPFDAAGPGRAEGAHAECGHLISPITGTPCAYYQYRVDEKRGHGKHQRWETIEQGDSAARGFYLEDETFQRLQERISELEERIADRREFYNDSVNAFNIRIEQLPDMILARFMRLTPRELFAVGAAQRLEADVSL